MTKANRLTRRGFLRRTLNITGASMVAPQIMAGSAPAHAADGTNGHWQIGCYTRPWGQHDYRVALDAIAEAGFKYAGLMSTKRPRRLVISAATSLEEAEKVGQEVRKRGMKIPSIYGGGIPVAKSLEAGIEALRKLIDNCVAAEGASLLMAGAGAKLHDRYCKAVAECCHYAAEKNLPITLKPHGGLNATGPQCRKCVETVGHENFSIWYDPGNIYYYTDGQLDPVDDAATVDGLVKLGMCIKDFRMSKREGKLRKDVSVTPGTGMVDFPAVLARLKKGGFTGGALVIECLGSGDDLKAILQEAKKARKFVEDLVGA